MTLSRCRTSRAFVGSNRGMRVRFAPTEMAAFIPTVWPNEWNSGRPPKTTSSGPTSTRPTEISALRLMLAWVSSAPLGVPVVPEV